MPRKAPRRMLLRDNDGNRLGWVDLTRPLPVKPWDGKVHGAPKKKAPAPKK